MLLNRIQQTLHYLLLISLVQGNENHACVPSVKYLRSKLVCTVGDSLTLNCTVSFCVDQTQKLEAYWCKLESNSCHPVTTNRTHTNNGKEERIFITYNIAYLNFSDSGKFQCRASSRNMTSVGHFITVNVTVASDAPVNIAEPTVNIYRWLFLFFLLPLMMLICVIRHCHMKQRLNQKRNGAEVQVEVANITASPSSPSITMATTGSSSAASTPDPHPVEACVNIGRKPSYVIEPVPIYGNYQESIYSNDPFSQ